MDHNTKRVTKNAFFLTMRMLLATIVGLYTSRLVLDALGDVDYGIYGVIGGVVAMGAFLNTAMAGATGRFINFELGKGDASKVNKIFSTSLLIHLFIALSVAILAETLGLWFVNNRMNFPDDKMFVVNVIYQFTILSMMVGFTQVPYTATIIAHEKMGVYAYVEILNVTLKLAIVYVLLTVKGDRLLLYAFMMFCSSLLTAAIYRIYCIKKFPESKFKFVWDKAIVKSMCTFSGFDLYGNMCTTLKFQSQPLLLNMFFGVISNVGSSIAYTVTGALGGLTNSIAQAFQPQIIKQYSQGDLKTMLVMMRRSVQFNLLAYAAVSLPIFVNTSWIIYLWLGQVPEYVVDFIKLIIISNFFTIVVTSSNTAIHATGNIKRISFYSGTMHLCVPIFSYILLKYVILDPNIVYIVNIFFLILIVLLGFKFMRIQLPDFDIKGYIFPIIRSGIVIVLVFVIVDCVTKISMSEMQLINSWTKLLSIIVVGLTGAGLLFVMSMIVAFDKEERQFVFSFIRNKIKLVIFYRRFCRNPK